MNRRGFIGSIAALATVPAIAAHPRPWEVPGTAIIGKTFTVDAPIEIASGVTISNCVFYFANPVKYCFVIYAPEHNILITNTKFEVPPSWIISSGEIAL